MELFLDLDVLFVMHMKLFSRNFARYLDQFKWDFCWTGLVVYGFGPRSTSNFEDCSIQATGLDA